MFRTFSYFSFLLPLLALCGKCPQDVNDHIDALLSIPKSLSLPLGRAFVAYEFGKALIMDSIRVNETEYMSSSTVKIPYDSGGEKQVITIVVSACELENPRKKLAGSLDICKVSLYARIFGPEVIASEATGRMNGVCMWTFRFEVPTSLPLGDYTIEALSMWINESDEPDQHIRDRDLESRANDGSVIHLGGMGTHPYHLYNGTHLYHNFHGYLVQGNSRSVYLMFNGTRRPFHSFGDLIDLGYESVEIFRVPETFLRLFPVGEKLSSADKNATADNMNTKNLHKNDFVKSLIRKINDKVVFNVDDEPRREACIFRLPKISITADKGTTATVPTNDRPKCRGSDSSYGRWVVDSSCAAFSSPQAEAVFETIPVGHKCQQSIPVYAKGMPLFFKNFLRYLVWRPYNCMLTQYKLKMSVNSKTNQFDESGIGDYNIPSSLAHSLRLAGVGFIAGFGDSLGDEQRDNIISLLNRNYEWSSGHGITCQNNKLRLHKLHLTIGEPKSPLVECIQNVFLAMNSSVHIYPSKENSVGLFNDYVSRVDGNTNENTVVPVKQVVLFTNFMSQHRFVFLPNDSPTFIHTGSKLSFSVQCLDDELT